MVMTLNQGDTPLSSEANKALDTLFIKTNLEQTFAATIEAQMVTLGELIQDVIEGSERLPKGCSLDDLQKKMNDMYENFLQAEKLEMAA